MQGCCPVHWELLEHAKVSFLFCCRLGTFSWLLSQLEGGDGAGLRPAFELCLLCKGTPHLPRDTGIGYPMWLAD